MASTKKAGRTPKPAAGKKGTTAGTRNLFRVKAAKGQTKPSWILLDVTDPKRPMVAHSSAEALQFLGAAPETSPAGLARLLKSLPPAEYAEASAVSTIGGEYEDEDGEEVAAEEGIGFTVEVVWEPRSGLWFGQFASDSGGDSGDWMGSATAQPWKGKSAKKLAQEWADEIAQNYSI